MNEMNTKCWGNIGNKRGEVYVHYVKSDQLCSLNCQMALVSSLFFYQYVLLAKESLNLLCWSLWARFAMPS
jgi:hypothetical protein